MTFSEATTALDPERDCETVVVVEEHVSSRTSTPLPIHVGPRVVDATFSRASESDAAATVRAAARVIERLAFLPTNAEDEAMVEQLVAERTSARRTTKL